MIPASLGLRINKAKALSTLRLVSALHWNFAEIPISLVVILTGHIWSMPSTMFVGTMLFAGASTRLLGYVLQPSGSKMCADSIWITSGCLTVAAVFLGSGWTWTGMAFLAVAKGVLIGTFMTAVKNDGNNFVPVDRVTP